MPDTNPIPKLSTYRGCIAGLSGHPMSGLWTLDFEDGSTCFIQSGYGVRQLAAAFGATEGNGDLQACIAGQDIVYSTDDLGVLEAFTPAQDWAAIILQCNTCNHTDPADVWLESGDSGELACPKCLATDYDRL